MALGAIELATIARSQDYSNIKHNENNKVITDQSNVVEQVQKEVESKTRQVQDSEDPQWHNKKFDAKEKGDGKYSGDGGKNRRKKQEEDGKVTLKGRGGFDMKI